MVAAVALMALVSCNKEEIADNGIINDEQTETPSDIVFVAEFDQEADTKIALGDLVDGVRKTTWVAGDEIKINGTVFSAKEAGELVEFTTTSSFAEAATYRAVYPAASYISDAAVEIPATQNGTFANAAIAVAESSTTSLKFNNLVTILKFQVPVNCSKVTFESTASLAGRITVNYTDGVMTPNYSGVTQPNKTINVNGSFVPGTDYYVAVKPDTHTFTVKIDGKVSKASTKAVEVERSQILNMGVLPEPKKSDRNLSFSATKVTGYTSGWVETPTLSGVVDGVKYTSSSPDVASVNSETGELTITEKKGTTTITASAPETDIYLAGEVSYELTVNQSNVRIYVRLWPKINNWDKWTKDPYIYYWGDYSSANFPGNKLKYEKNNDQYDYYYELEFSRTKKISFVVTCNQGEQSFDVANITLDKNYYYSVYTEWHDGGKLTINQDSTSNP